MYSKTLKAAFGYCFILGLFRVRRNWGTVKRLPEGRSWFSGWRTCWVGSEIILCFFKDCLDGVWDVVSLFHGFQPYTKVVETSSNHSMVGEQQHFLAETRKMCFLATLNQGRVLLDFTTFCDFSRVWQIFSLVTFLFGSSKTLTSTWSRFYGVGEGQVTSGAKQKHCFRTSLYIFSQRVRGIRLDNCISQWLRPHLFHLRHDAVFNCLLSLSLFICPAVNPCSVWLLFFLSVFHRMLDLCCVLKSDFQLFTHKATGQGWSGTVTL